MVANLLSNAAKFTPPEGHIRVSATQAGSEIELRVRDDGIAPDQLRFIFEPSCRVGARRLREEHAAILLVAVTGYGQPADRERARDAGFDEHVVKPVSLDVLLRLLRAGRRREAT